LALVKRSMGKVAETIDTAAHNSPAYRAAVNKMAELEQEFLKLSGKTASETLSPVTNAVKGTYDAIPGPLRNAIQATIKHAVLPAVGAGAVWKYLSGSK
ncbi:MAG: hypothetical protein ACHQX3_06960, partial [Nitrospirales bacterium]